MAKLTAADFGLADIECRFDTTYTINARLELQAYRGGSWVTFCSSTFGADSNAAGVAVATTFLVCQYPDMIGGEYHRSQLSYSTTADGIERQSYSASWYVQPG